MQRIRNRIPIPKRVKVWGFTDHLTHSNLSGRTAFVISFKDTGQDFLTWHLDAEGTVIKSIPLQSDIWEEYTVNLASLAIGHEPEITRWDGKKMTVNHAIAAIADI